MAALPDPPCGYLPLISGITSSSHMTTIYPHDDIVAPVRVLMDFSGAPCDTLGSCISGSTRILTSFEICDPNENLSSRWSQTSTLFFK